MFFMLLVLVWTGLSESDSKDKRPKWRIGEETPMMGRG